MAKANILHFDDGQVLLLNVKHCRRRFVARTQTIKLTFSIGESWHFWLHPVLPRWDVDTMVVGCKADTTWKTPLGSYGDIAKVYKYPDFNGNEFCVVWYSVKVPNPLGTSKNGKFIWIYQEYSEQICKNNIDKIFTNPYGQSRNGVTNPDYW